MRASDTASNASTATGVSQNRVLLWGDIEEGTVGLANFSIKHAIVTALTSVLPASALSPDSVLRKDLEDLPNNNGKNRPFLVLEKPRGKSGHARIALTTHFGGRPVKELDDCAQMLSVALGSLTPPWPNEDSPRITIKPEWNEKNSYALAYSIELKYGKRIRRFRNYTVAAGEIAVLDRLCKARCEALAGMSPEERVALQKSYEDHAVAYRSEVSYRKSVVTVARSQAPALPSISENGPAGNEPEADEDGFILYTGKHKRRGSASSRASGNSRRR